MEKKLIRHGVFETNSSSSHSISIADENKDFVMDYIYPNENGEVILTGGEFGWEWFKENDALTKANYIVSSYGVTEELKRVIMEHTGAIKVFYLPSDEWSSYVDHDSLGVAPKDIKDLKDFIFNKNSWLFGGNDNSQAEPMFYDVPIYTKDGGIIDNIYDYELIIDNINKTIKFKEYPTKEMLEKAFISLFEYVLLNEDGKVYDVDEFIFNLKSKPNNLYEYTYRNKYYFDDSHVTLVKENTLYLATEIWREEHKDEDFRGPNAYSKIREIEQNIINDPNSGATIKIPYHVNKL